jgi:hypothetical protein
MYQTNIGNSKYDVIHGDKAYYVLCSKKRGKCMNRQGMISRNRRLPLILVIETPTTTKGERNGQQKHMGSSNEAR